MVCCCKNPDGGLADQCTGLCLKNAIQHQNEIQKRDPLNGFTELILAQVEMKIKYHLALFKTEIEKEKLELYKKAFLEGLKEGINIGRYLID